ncbi:MAG: glycosyltransferase [Flavobacteriaceae bacterium]|nr:glycosyltransferase [Flavobacteriaceae bacterium]
MRILVIQQKMIGDVLVSSILCENLKKAYPNSQVDYMIYESTAAVLEGNPFIDNLILFTKTHRNNKRSFYKLIKQLNRNDYDVVIDAYSKLESWIPVFFLNAPVKISYQKSGRKFLYTHSIKLLEEPTSNIGLIIERRLSLLSPLRLPISLDSKPKLYLSNDEKAFADSKFEQFGIDKNKKTVMMSIIGSSIDKTYPLTNMSKVIDFVVEKLNCNILFNYIPNQLNDAQIIFDACREQTQKNVFFDLLGGNLREFIAIMNHCDMIIGNDGGAINMAKALDKPSFIIFSPWIEKQMWATFEDGKFHKSVHLKDYNPELFRDKSQKELKSESLNLYSKFDFSYFKQELNNFLEYHNVKQQIPKYKKTVSSTSEKLTVLVITFNEIGNIDELIESISFADEIIVVDSFSTDGTFEALQKQEKVKVVQRKFINFSNQRNYAASLASNKWVLFVDADERIPNALQIEVLDNINNPKNTKIFGMYREMYFNGGLLKYGGYQTEKVYRLYHTDFTKYNSNKLVHEVLELKSKPKLLKNKIIHYSYISDDNYKKKLELYARLQAKELKQKGKKAYLFLSVVKPAYRFIHLWFVRFGFLDGKRGFKMAKLSAYGVKQRYKELKKLVS